MDKTKIRKGRSISWEEREAMIKEYMTGECSKKEIWEKYTGQDEEHGQMLIWMRKLGYLHDKPISILRRGKLLTFQAQFKNTLDNPANEKDPVLLQKKLKELERQLEIAQLKAEGYELMIDIAEKELKIPIRKKSDTK